jgi:hypothetical protein
MVEFLASLTPRRPAVFGLPERQWVTMPVCPTRPVIRDTFTHKGSSKDRGRSLSIHSVQLARSFDQRSVPVDLQVVFQSYRRRAGGQGRLTGCSQRVKSTIAKQPGTQLP